MDNSSIGDRQKRYESVSRAFLPRRIPVIIRLDGKSFHTLTRKHFGRKYNEEFGEAMAQTAVKVMDEMQGCSLCYVQSDEMSFLLTDYATISTDAWFGYNVNKMLSISAAVASVEFTHHIGDKAYFDARAFSVPQDDVCNGFLWRQFDATRNSIQMAAQELYSHNDLHKKGCSVLQEMLFQKDVNWNDFPTKRKRGICIVNKEIDYDIPIFSQNRNYIEQHVFVRKD